MLALKRFSDYLAQVPPGITPEEAAKLWGTYNVRRPDGSWDPATVVAAPASTNWVGWALWTTGGRSAINMASGGYDIDHDPEDFVKMSAVFSLYKSKTPMLIESGDDDPVLVDAIGVYNAVREVGVAVTFVRYPGQGHVLTGDAMQDFWNRQMAFFATYLQVPPAKTKAQ